MKRLLFILFPCLIAAQQQDAEPPVKTPQQIQQELDEDEALYKRAYEMFNPWYTGPLLTPSATLMSVGAGNIQPYIFVNDYYAAYGKDRKSRDLPSSRIALNPVVGFTTGITNTMDYAITVGAIGSWQYNTSGGGFQDISMKLGWPITRQSLYMPAMKFSISQSFPTGRYQNLNTNGFNLSATGAGAWTTQFGFAISKVMFWSYLHPVNARLYLGYSVSTPVTVHGFNAYGGGFGTKGRVHPGNAFTSDFGIEYSITQRWVLSCDAVYNFQQETTFSGNPGATAAGTAASVGGPYNDQLSLAPALEYNWNPNLGILGGAWFTVYGRSSSAFVSGIISVSYSFGP